VRAQHTPGIRTDGEGAVARLSPGSSGLREVELTPISRFSASC
jgi:hypothetical protein